MLSKRTKYGLKAMVHLAREADHGPVQIYSISKSEGIPQKFLESILLSLKKSGFLGSKKGKGGGYYLLKSPDKVSVADVYRVLEGPIAMVPCVSLNFYETCEDCQSEETCSINKVMTKLRDSSLNILTKTFLSDLI